MRMRYSNRQYAVLLLLLVILNPTASLAVNSFFNPDSFYRGWLWFEEIQRIDWEQVDFTEFIEDFKLKFFGGYKAPSSAALGKTVNQGVSEIAKLSLQAQDLPRSILVVIRIRFA